MWYSNGVDLHPRAPVRYMKNYEWRKSTSNIYKEPKSYSPIYYIRNSAAATAPISTTQDSKFFITVVKEPRKVRMGNPSIAGSSYIACELPDFTHDEIMAIALDDAGVATRDQALMQLNKANKDNLSETF